MSIHSWKAMRQPVKRGGAYVYGKVKHKVSQGYSPADLPIQAKNKRELGTRERGLAYALRDDDP
jgi:hypothetical protein